MAEEGDNRFCFFFFSSCSFLLVSFCLSFFLSSFLLFSSSFLLVVILFIFFLLPLSRVPFHLVGCVGTDSACRQNDFGENKDPVRRVLLFLEVGCTHMSSGPSGNVENKPASIQLLSETRPCGLFSERFTATLSSQHPQSRTERDGSQAPAKRFPFRRKW